MIRFSIFLFSYLGLGCLIYFVVVAAFGRVAGIAHPFSITVEAIGAIEIIWYLAIFLPRKSFLQKREGRYVPPALTRSQRKALFHQSVNLVPDQSYFARKWLLYAHWDDIRRENIKDWLLWALWDRDGLPGDDDEELEEYLVEIETQLGMVIGKGRGEAEALRLSFDKVRMTHRSLFYYMVSALVTAVGMDSYWVIVH